MIRTRIAILLLSLACAGCGSTDSQPADSSRPEAARSDVERGPVRLTVEITPATIRLSDEPTLTLTIRSRTGVEIDEPPFGDAIGDFLIRDYHRPLPNTDGEFEIRRQIYTLEPTRTGTLTIAPIAVRFRDHRPNSDSVEHVIESEAVSVNVSTTLGEAAPTLTDLKPPAGPVELPSSGPPAWLWLTGGLVVAAVVGAGWYLRRCQTVRSEPHLSPQELAELELRQIISRRLAEYDVKRFYVELTGVVRRYIERSTGIRAPEQTTEEFLREIIADTTFTDNDQRRLREFLEAADLVKFAGAKPENEDLQTSINRAQEFIRLNHEITTETAA